MARSRTPGVPPRIWEELHYKFSKADCAEIIWDLICQSPWFDETTASESQSAVLDKFREILKIYKEQR